MNTPKTETFYSIAFYVLPNKSLKAVRPIKVEDGVAQFRVCLFMNKKTEREKWECLSADHDRCQTLREQHIVH